MWLKLQFSQCLQHYDISYLTNVRHSVHFYLKFYAYQGSTLMLAHELLTFLSGTVDGKYV